MDAWRTILNWLALVGCEASAQLTLKLAAIEQSADAGLAQWLLRLSTNKYFVVSLACDLAGFVAWMTILRRHDLSLAVPLSSLCYFAIIAVSVVVLHENVAGLQVGGLATIAIGILLINGDATEPRSIKSTTRLEERK